MQDYTLILPLDTYRKIMAYATVCDTEITGFADVVYNKKTNQFVAGEVYLIPQEGGGTHVHIDEEEMAKFNLERIKAGATQLPQLWWHSHVDMSAFFSGIDEDELIDLQNDTFCIALVVNKRFEMKAMAYIYEETKTVIKSLGETIKDEEKGWTKIDPLNVRVQIEHAAVPEEIVKEVKAKVKKPAPHIPSIFKGWGKKQDDDFSSPLQKANFLPKDPNEARERVEKLGLIKYWYPSIKQYIWKDPDSGQVWLDHWNSLDEDEPVDPSGELSEMAENISKHDHKDDDDNGGFWGN